MRSVSHLGLDIGSHTIKVAALQVGSAGAEIRALLEHPIPEPLLNNGRLVDPEGLSEEIFQILTEAKLRRPRAAIQVGSGEVFIRRISSRRQDKQQALLALPKDGALAKLPSIDPRQAKYDLDIVDPDAASAKMTVILAAAKQDTIRVRQQIIANAGVEVDFVDVDSLALFNAFQFCHPVETQERLTLVDIGARTAEVVVTSDGAPGVARSVEYGVYRLITEMTRGNAVVRSRDAERAIFSPNPVPLYPDAFETWAAGLAKELRSSAGFLSRGDQDTGKIYITGGGSTIDGLTDLLSRHLGVPVDIFDPLRSLPYARGFQPENPLAGPFFSVAIGLALRFHEAGLR